MAKPHGRADVEPKPGAVSPVPFDRFVLDSLPIAVVTVDPDRRVTGFNPSAERITGHPRAEVMGRFCGEVLQGSLCQVACPLQTVLRRESSILHLETTIRDREGRTVPVRMSTAALFDDEGALLGGLEAFQDISEIKQAERDRDNLTSMVAHDLKSAIVIIGGFARHLLASLKIPGLDGPRKQLEIIKKEADRLDSLMSEFLEFSRLQSGKLALNCSAVCLETVLSELLEAYQFRAEKANIRVVLQADAQVPIIQADPNRLHRVFANLLDNAIKYSEPGTSVEISMEDRGEEVIVRFRDQGRGIQPSELPYLFDPFRRAPGAEARQGFGLGLATVKAVVNGHGGRVEVESELGKGTVFSVVLPKGGPGSRPQSPSGYPSEP